MIFTVSPIPFYLYTHIEKKRNVGILYTFSPLGTINAHNHAYRLHRWKCYFANHESRAEIRQVHSRQIWERVDVCLDIENTLTTHAFNLAWKYDQPLVTEAYDQSCCQWHASFSQPTIQRHFLEGTITVLNKETPNES